jgi:hemerythrin
MAVQVLQFLKDWLEKHIKGSDLAYAPYLKAQKVA